MRESGLVRLPDWLQWWPYTLSRSLALRLSLTSRRRHVYVGVSETAPSDDGRDWRR